MDWLVCVIYLIKMWFMLLATLTSSAVYADTLVPSCSKPVYCNSTLLHHVQLARIYNDSKIFVDLQMKNDQNSTLAAFGELLKETNDNPSQEQIKEFVNEYFDEASELETWTPPDYKPDPDFLASIRDEQLREFGKNINDIWPTLGRRVKAEVFEDPDRFSFIPVNNGFIIPGGRFKELYYWDTYWIIEGLLISGMKDTVKGVIGNLIKLLRTLGHIPNGSRWYYQERSQPPLLTEMMYLYIKKTNDTEFLKENINDLEKELNYWLDKQVITFRVNGKSHTLLRYYAPSEGPRPESYYEDYTQAQLFEKKERQRQFYIDIKSAAESGWDFSTRWFINKEGKNNGCLSTIHTTEIIPVDLNSIFANALLNVAKFQSLLTNPRRASYWAYLANEWRNTIKEVLWNKEDGIWYDWDLTNQVHRKYFYPSNLAPLWMGAVDKIFVKINAPRILEWLIKSHGLGYQGGVPTSLIRSGEQWDFPNAWPPLVSVVVNALEALETKESLHIAFEVAQSWVKACHTGFTENKQMFEKYDVEQPGKVGGGGEYTVQTGFGWSNGVVLEFLAKYGNKMSLNNSVNPLPVTEQNSN